MDSTPIIQALHQQQKSCYLPLVSADVHDKKLTFALYQPETKLRLNRYHVPEPQNSTIIQQANALDIVIVPLLAFDKQGLRLGTGGGFYDYTFSFLIHAKPHKPLLLGLAYEIQRVPQLPQEIFDVPLDAVVTEEGVLVFDE